MTTNTQFLQLINTFQSNMWFLLSVILILTLVYILLRENYNYWKKRNVPGPEPKFIVGNMGENFLMRKSVGEIITGIYNQYQDYPFVGIFRASTPCLLVRDPELIRNVFVKDFKSFPNNDMEIDKKTDPLFGRNPFVLKGEEWKNTRALITPCFTSGKMKIIFPLLLEVSKRMIKYIEAQPDATTIKGMESKELCTKFTLDNVASVAFGIEGRCFENPKAEFRELARKFVSPGSISNIKLTIMVLFPKLARFFSVKLVPKDVEDKLMELVKATLDFRKQNNIVRTDFLNFLNELKTNSKHQTFNHVDIVAQASGFFGDGFETSSIVMSFVLFEIGCHPDIQQKLREEIEGKVQENNGELTYEALIEMPYLDACVQESLRKNPNLLTLGKVCNESYTYETSNTEDFKRMSITIEPGTSIIIPIGALHADEKYFPEPKTFNPDRFLAENKNDLTKFTFLPFGEGPRICIGQRFGLLQVKLGLAQIVRHFKVTLNNNTKLPLTYDPTYFLQAPIGGLWLNFEKIK